MGSGATLGTVSGTISGVQDNATTTSGLIATVLSTPDGQNQGRTFSSLEPNLGGNITVSGGVITSVGLYFFGSNINSTDGLFLGSGAYYPGYNVNNVNSSAYTLESDPSATTTFSSATPVPFDFSNSKFKK